MSEQDDIRRGAAALRYAASEMARSTISVLNVDEGYATGAIGGHGIVRLTAEDCARIVLRGASNESESA